MGEKYHEQQGKANILLESAKFDAGQVEGEVQGEDEVLERFWKDIDQGPHHSQVDKVDKSDIEALEDEKAFVVRR